MWSWFQKTTTLTVQCSFHCGLLIHTHVKAMSVLSISSSSTLPPTPFTKRNLNYRSINLLNHLDIIQDSKTLCNYSCLFDIFNNVSLKMDCAWSLWECSVFHVCLAATYLHVIKPPALMLPLKCHGRGWDYLQYGLRQPKSRHLDLLLHTGIMLCMSTCQYALFWSLFTGDAWKHMRHGCWSSLARRTTDVLLCWSTRNRWLQSQFAFVHRKPIRRLVCNIMILFSQSSKCT